MKKFISFVMAGAMVASLVPATAFAAGEVTATAKVVDSLSMTKDEATAEPIISEEVGSSWVTKVPELQLKITNTDYRKTQADTEPTVDVTVTLDGAKFNVQKDGTDLSTTPATAKAQLAELVNIKYVKDRGGSAEQKFFENSSTGKAIAKVDVNGDIVEIISENVDRDPDFADAENVDGIKWLIAQNRELTVTAGATASPESIWLVDGATKKQLFDGAELLVDDAVFIDHLANDYAKLFKEEAGTTSMQFGAANTTEKFTVSIDKTANADGTASAINATTLADTTFDMNKAAKIALVTNPADVKQGDLEIVAGDDAASPIDGITWEVKDYDDDQITYTFKGKFAVDDVIVFDLCSTLDKTGVGREATVSVTSNMVNADDLVYASVKGRGITASTRKTTTIAVEEMRTLDKDLVIKSTVGDFDDGQWFELKLSKGFEFTKATVSSETGKYKFSGRDGNVIYVKYIEAANVNAPTVGENPDQDQFTIKAKDIEIEATSAKADAVCTMTVKALKDGGATDTYTATTDGPGTFTASTTVEVAKVVDYVVNLSVDEDEDVPVIYSGVNVNNDGITDDSDHMSLEVTAQESFPGAWSFRKGFNFELPEGVYVTDITVVETDGFLKSNKTNAAVGDADPVEVDDVEEAFFNAYQEGSHVNFEFEKRVFDDVDAVLNKDEGTMTFQLELVADPGFEGDVVLKLTGELVDEQEVTIAKFVKPYEVKAEQNDIIIDYRYTDIPTAITITEAEKGLWEKSEAKFWFDIDKSGNGTFMSFEDDPTFEIDSKSGMEIKDAKANDGRIEFTVKTESDEAATITIKDMQLFMNRSIPAGPYDLSIGSSLANAYEREVLFAPDGDKDFGSKTAADAFRKAVDKGEYPKDNDERGANEKEDCFVGDVADYSTTVKEGFVNVVTAGRDVDDASFTTKVVVPVGESYIVAGEKQIELDTPAYINAAGYTMLPIRAVATALGINNNNVLWDQPTKTVTILYGQRIITMTQGQKVVYVNGSAIPASAAVENTNSRTFLPMRDLATALGVTDITWDQATRTATLNGNQK